MEGTEQQELKTWTRRSKGGDRPSRPQGHDAERGRRGAGDRSSSGRVEGDRGGVSSQEAPRGDLNPPGHGALAGSGEGLLRGLRLWYETCLPWGGGESLSPRCLGEPSAYTLAAKPYLASLSLECPSLELTDVSQGHLSM